MSELIYYVDSAGLCESNSMLAEMGCEECLKKECSDRKPRNLWRLPDRAHLDDFLRKTKPLQLFARIFCAKTREGKPRKISIEDIDLSGEGKLRRHRRHTPIKYIREEAANLMR